MLVTISSAVGFQMIHKGPQTGFVGVSKGSRIEHFAISASYWADLAAYEGPHAF